MAIVQFFLMLYVHQNGYDFSKMVVAHEIIELRVINSGDKCIDNNYATCRQNQNNLFTESMIMCILVSSSLFLKLKVECLLMNTEIHIMI